jgi:hypothetical protein
MSVVYFIAPHIQHKMFVIVLLTIYLDEGPSAMITILTLFPEIKKAVRAKLEFPENIKCNPDKNFFP